MNYHENHLNEDSVKQDLDGETRKIRIHLRVSTDGYAEVEDEVPASISCDPTYIEQWIRDAWSKQGKWQNVDYDFSEGPLYGGKVVAYEAGAFESDANIAVEPDFYGFGSDVMNAFKLLTRGKINTDEFMRRVRVSVVENDVSHFLSE